MPPRSNKSRRQQTITYNLSSAHARDAFEEELELEDADIRNKHTTRRTGRGSAAFSLAADIPLSLHERDVSGMHEYASPQATADIINLLELFGASLDREVIESVYMGCNSNFNLAMERLLELAASSGAGAAPDSGGVDQDGTAAEAAAAAAAEASTEVAPDDNDVCYWDLLPEDLKRHVFAFLNSRDLARVARTCRDFAGPARSVRTNTRQLQIPTGLGMHGIMAMVAGHPNARSVSLRQWAGSPLSDNDFTALVVALSAGSRSERRAVPVEALSFKGCRWLSDGHVMAVCHTMQHLKEVDLTDCVGITDAALVALSKYQRMAPEGSSSSDDDDYDAYVAPPASSTAPAASMTPPPGTRDPTAGGRGQRSDGGGGDGGAGGDDDDGGDRDGDEELQFAFEVTPAPQQRQSQMTDARGDDAAAALGSQSEAGLGSDGEDDEGNEEGQGHGRGATVSSSSSSSDDEEGDEVAAMSPSSALRGAFTAGLALSPATAAAGPKLQGSDAAGPVAGTTSAEAAVRGDIGRARRVTNGSDSSNTTPLCGTSPTGGGMMGSSYGAARGGAASSWMYGTSPAAAAAAGATPSGTKSWLYGTSPVMGASPFFRTGGSASISHNGWLARAATAATKKDSGRGLMSINLSGCSAISSDGVRALLAAPLTKACLLQLDISRCPRITRAALVLPATSNLCVLRASACHNLHEVIMQLPLTSPLTELHLADCKALSKLHVVAPALQQLHVGTCRHLTRLHLRCPQLRHLTASLCFRLVDLDPERWEVGRLEHLNLFGCRHLEWPGLAALLAKCGPTLRHLDMNGCNALVVADIPEGNDALRHLDASGCKSLVALRCSSPALAALALRSCPRLQEVAVDSAALEKLDISNCPHLQRLSMPALHQQQQLLQQEPGQQPAAGALAPAGGRLAVVPSGQVGALRAAVSGAAPAGPEAAAGAGGGAAAAGGGSTGSTRGGGAGVMVRMAGCDRLPVEIAVLLRRLREKAKQQAAAAAAATPAAATTGGRPGTTQGGGDLARQRA